jgi:hypothetical protein
VSRPPRILLLPIPLALLTTFAIAWLGAAFETSYHATATQEVLVFNSFTSRYYMQRGYTITRIGINWDFDAKLAPINPSWIDAATHPELAHAPSWSQAWLTTRPTRPPGTWGGWPHEACLNEFAAGWPMRALWCESDEPTQDPVTTYAVYSHRGGLTLPTHIIKAGATIFLPRVLPYRPLWTGLLIDTALFTLVWSLLLLTAPALKSWRRTKGRCTTCGYDLKGLAADAPCPECGYHPSANSMANQ